MPESDARSVGQIFHLHLLSRSKLIRRSLFRRRDESLSCSLAPSGWLPGGGSGYSDPTSKGHCAGVVDSFFLEQ